jgi:hypothetical protein
MFAYARIYKMHRHCICILYTLHIHCIWSYIHCTWLLSRPGNHKKWEKEGTQFLSLARETHRNDTKKIKMRKCTYNAYTLHIQYIYTAYILHIHKIKQEQHQQKRAATNAYTYKMRKKCIYTAYTVHIHIRRPHPTNAYTLHLHMENILYIQNPGEKWTELSVLTTHERDIGKHKIRQESQESLR